MDSEITQSKHQIKLTENRRSDIEYIDKTFNISDTINKLHVMVTEVTKDSFDAKSVNAACNCISQLNATINTTISAARFLREI